MDAQGNLIGRESCRVGNPDFGGASYTKPCPRLSPGLAERVPPKTIIYARYFFISASISLTAVSKPTIIARLTMLWPMFNSTR